MVHDAGKLETILYHCLTRCGKLLRHRTKTHPWPKRTLTLGTVAQSHAFLPEGTPLRWTPNQRARHLFCLGGSGCGKSYWLASLMLQDLERGNPFALIDPHGDLVELLLGHVAHQVSHGDRTVLDRLILIEPAAATCVGFNPLQLPKDSPDQVFSRMLELVDIFARFSDYGPETDELLRRSLLALVSAQLTLLELRPFLLNEVFRSRVIATLTQRDERDFWTQQYDRLSESEKLRCSRPLLRRIERFTADPNLRVMLGQQEGVCVRSWMDAGKTVLISLPKGLLKDCELLASLFAAQFYWSALSRADTSPDKRRPYCLYLDEAQNFLGDGAYTEEVLSESRKYGLSLVCATQSLAFLPPEARASLLANCSTHVLFRLNPADATGMSLEIAPSGRSRHVEKLLNLPPRSAYISIRGEVQPTRIQTLEVDTHTNRAAVRSLRTTLHIAIGKDRKEVERAIDRRHQHWAILSEHLTNTTTATRKDTEHADERTDPEPTENSQATRAPASVRHITTTARPGQFAPKRRS